MKVLGIYIAKEQLRYAFLEGSKKNPTLLEKNRMITPEPNDVPALMDWYESQFTNLIKKLNPDKIAYRLTLGPNKEQLFTSIFPLGILSLQAYKEGIPIKEYVHGSFVASKLDLPNGTDLYNHCDQKFGVLRPHWDKPQKYSILVAWFEL